MASGGSDQDAEYALSKLLQMGTVAEYQNEVKRLINRVTGISESLIKTFYISGFKPALQCALLRSNPTTLGEAFSLAHAAKARFTKLQLRELLRSTPSTLGEAFFRARITEASFEYENNQAVINNVGDDDTDNVDVGYIRQHIEDVSWFLAHEIDYLNDNEKNADHGNRVIRVRLNDKHIKKKKMEAAIQRRIWDLRVLFKTTP
ncbi:hypothetical protein Tco_0693208 [Tanacetum coccineum]